MHPLGLHGSGVRGLRGPGRPDRDQPPGRTSPGWASTAGEAELWDGDTFGTAVNRAARLMAVGHGGQVVYS